MTPCEHYSTGEIEATAHRRQTDQRPETVRFASTVRQGTRGRGRSPRAPRLVLAALDDACLRGATLKLLRLHGFDARGIATASEAIDVVRAERPAAFIVGLAEGGRGVAVAMPLPQPVVWLSSRPRSGEHVVRIRPRTRLMTTPCSILLLIEAVQAMLASADEVTGVTSARLGDRPPWGRSSSRCPRSCGPDLRGLPPQCREHEFDREVVLAVSRIGFTSTTSSEVS